MRRFVSGVLLVIASPAWTAGPTRLDTADELARLQASNPRHYAEATKLMAAANVLCSPTAPQVQEVTLDSRHLQCGALFKTSNPPKREIFFTLDGVDYAALVSITADPPRLTPAK
jgi:hypothetical protein